jgi:hypothetical protein
MPGFNGTGPRGMGPMTGGGRGFCAVPVRQTWPAYARMGLHMPYVAPWSIPYWGAPSFNQEALRNEELNYLKGLAQSMREDLKTMEERIQQIEDKKE